MSDKLLLSIKSSLLKLVESINKKIGIDKPEKEDSPSRVLDHNLNINLEMKIRKYADGNEIPFVLFKAVIWQESRFNIMAKSNSGAIGLSQLMPGTADEMGVKDPYDPDQNLSGGARYLKKQYDRLDDIKNPLDRWRMALASYNCGYGYVRAAIRELKKMGYPSNKWCYVGPMLMIAKCNGRTAQWRQTNHYVDVIILRMIEYAMSDISNGYTHHFIDNGK